MKLNKYTPGYQSWLTTEGRKILESGYLLDGETQNCMFHRVASAAAKYLKGGVYSPHAYEIFYHILSKGWLGLSTPVAANLGTDRGLPISCYLSSIENSVAGIGDGLKEAMLLGKYGGGLGHDFSKINGITPAHNWAKMYDMAASNVKQGGNLSKKNGEKVVRKGSMAAYLRIDHPDIIDFLNAKELLKGDQREKIDSNIAVTIPNSFLEKIWSYLFDNKIEYQKEWNIWVKVLELSMSYGSPYLLFLDNVQDADPIWYKEKGYKTTQSNLCVSGDTFLLMKHGGMIYEDFIVNYVDRDVTVWNGKSWCNTTVRRTGTNQKLLRFTFTEENTQTPEQLTCTPYHKFYLENGKEKRAYELEVGDKIIVFDYPLDDGSFQKMSYTVFITPEDEDDYILGDTYCVNEPSEHKVVFNGILTGQCNEIMLHTDEKITAVCCLSSLNLALFDDWENVDIYGYSIPFWSTVFLDCVMSEFLSKTENKEGFDKAYFGAWLHRPLGLGVIGYHTYLQQNLVPFESEGARAINHRVFSYIKEEASYATKHMAKELGEPVGLEGYNVRNSHLLACAPTTSNSILAGGVSQGIEPIASNYYLFTGSKGMFIRQNKVLKRFLKSINQDTDDIWKSISEHDGSVQHLNISQMYKDVFKTAMEINQEEIVRQAADRQKYICQGQSLNLFISPDEDSEKIHYWHLLAWKLGVKGRYYIRSKNIKAQKGNQTDQQNPTQTHYHLLTRPDCIYCTKAKQLLESLGFSYTEELKSKGLVPEVYFNNEIIGGFNELNKLLTNEIVDNGECLACEG